MQDKWKWICWACVTCCWNDEFNDVVTNGLEFTMGFFVWNFAQRWETEYRSVLSSLRKSHLMVISHVVNYFSSFRFWLRQLTLLTISCCRQGTIFAPATPALLLKYVDGRFALLAKETVVIFWVTGNFLTILPLDKKIGFAPWSLSFTLTFGPWDCFLFSLN